MGAICGAERVRGWLASALVVVFALLLSACSAGSILTDSAAPGAGEPRGKTVPPIAFQDIRGIPPGKLAELKGALSSAGGLHDIGFIEGNLQSGAFGLAGTFKASSSSAGVEIIYQWQFRDGEGVLIGNLDGEENAGVFSGSDPWAGVSTAVLDRIARRTADDMARKLNQMGYATRLSGLTVPPAEFFAMASPDAHREIDFETVNGPGLGAAGAAFLAGADQVVEHEEIQPTVAMVEPIAGEGLMPQIAQSETPGAAAPPDMDDTGGPVAAAQPVEEAAPPPRKPKPGQRAIRAVAVLPVKGSPGGGDAELTAAMRKTLSAAGWPVVSKPQPDALTIVGRVKVADKGKSQAVSVNWMVQAPDGKSLGDVKQSNDVPRGALDEGWGTAALAVAEAAAPGIFDIVKRFR